VTRLGIPRSDWGLIKVVANEGRFAIAIPLGLWIAAQIDGEVVGEAIEGRAAGEAAFG